MSPTRITAALSALGLAGALSLAAAAPATAAPDRTHPCSAGRVCAYDLHYFEGDLTSSPPIAPGACLWVRGGYASIMNHTSVTERLWSRSDCTGYSMTIPPGAQYNFIQFQDGTVGAAIGGFP